MSFKRRHYEELAAALKAAQPFETGTLYGLVRTGQHARDCRAVADVLEHVNPGFNRERFLRDCGAGS
jgi:hypothetical protein